MTDERKSIRAVNNVYIATVVLYFAAQFSLELLYALFRFQLTTFQSFILTQSMLAVPAVVYMVKNKINVKEFIRFKKLGILTILLVAMLTVFLIPLLNFVSMVSMLFSKNFIGGAVDDLVSGGSFVVALFTVAVVPAVLEESVYRGVFYNEYRKANTGKAILFSALFFGLLHMNFNQFSYAFILGAIFCFIIEATDSILSTMIIHFIINGWSTVLLKVTPIIQNTLDKVSESAGEVTGISELTTQTMSKEYILQVLPTLAVSALVSGAIASIIFYSIAKYNGRWDHIKGIFKRNPEQGSKQSFLTMPLVVIMLLELAFMVTRELM